MTNHQNSLTVEDVLTSPSFEQRVPKVEIVSCSVCGRRAVVQELREPFTALCSARDNNHDSVRAYGFRQHTSHMSSDELVDLIREGETLDADVERLVTTGWRESA